MPAYPPTATPLQVGVPGGPELVILLLILVLLFGASRIPKLARSTGRATAEFRRGREEIERELREAQEGEAESDEGDGAATSAEATAGNESP